ncbi:MAG: 4-hydroxy-tetrahydrodipicolinate reductase [Bacteroidales bacterium]|nr:4-hydroxy-tetrahydrodipicolinate reductase [Bacteroidales bacterium]
MNIAIIGYGKMGREIERIARQRGHKISLVIDMDNTGELNASGLAETDVAIEFSSPASAFDNISHCLKAKTPVVSGTTGWLDSYDEIVQLAHKTETGFFYASNFSIGVNILFAINTRLAELMNNFPQYEVSMEEVHHIHKLDAPSGTAISLAEQAAAKLTTKDSWSLSKNENRKIYINAIREDEVNGFHKVVYDSEADTITISHNAKSREGFASGAVLAAEYMENRTGIHSMKTLLDL